jgi:hypothetical protein
VAALVMINPSNNLCFGPWNLHAFGKYGDKLGEWRPYGQWQIKYWYGNSTKRAVVRLIATLNSTQVQNVYNPSTGPRSDYYDTYAFVFITANVKYLQLNVHIYWKPSQTNRADYGLWFASVMGKGEPTTFGYLRYNGTVYSLNYDWASPLHEENENHGSGQPMIPGYWGAHWNNQFGRGIILNEAGLQSLRSVLDPSRTRFSITEAAPDGAKQGSIEFEAVNCEGSSYNPPAGLNYYYTIAMWMYGGGSYAEINNYYYMFLETYAPIIRPRE